MELLNSEKLNELSKQISSPVPFWFLNGYMEEWHVVCEFEMMKEKGIEDVIVHPRYGLQTKYLSDDWFELFGICVREAKKHGMHVWIYDELNWPSGTAGMSVMKMNEDYQGKYLAVESVPLDEATSASFKFGKYVIAASMEAGCITKTRLISDASELSQLSGDWRVFNCNIKHDPAYIDTLSWDAVNCFKHVTYDKYYERFGQEFGDTIHAIFTDEPSVYWVTVGYDDWNLPYTSDYFETFEARYGYSPAEKIPYLFYPSAKGAEFRADYWEHAGFLFNERYHGNLGAWCREHGVIFTGHNNHEEPLRYQIRFQGDMWGTMRAMDISGVDHLGKATLGNSWISIIGHKICSSQTHISGKARCMSESFGVMEWDTTFTNLKRVTDWQYALGINMLIPHAVYHTISGMTKRESPPSFFYQSPHWTDFEYFADYVKRLEKMLCGGKHLCRVAIMYPSSGLWASYQSDIKTPEFEYTDNFLNSLCVEMIKNQIDFDLVNFQALSEAELADGKMKLADEEYDVLIVPATPYLRKSEVARLTEVVGSGISTTLFHRAMEPIKNNLPEGLRGANFVRTEGLEAFAEVLKKQLDDDITISGGGADDIMVYRREKDGQKIAFLLNRSEKHRKVTAMIRNYPDAAIFDQETGEYCKLEGRQTGRKFQAQLRFQPNQSYFLVSNVPDAPASSEPQGEPIPIALGDISVEVPFNTATVYHFNYSADNSEPVQVDVRTNPRYIPCNWSPQAPNFEAYAGNYDVDVEVNCPTDGIRMILDKDFAECQVLVNGMKVELKPCCVGSDKAFYLTDFQDVEADISSLLKQGKNSFRVVSPTKLSEPLRLVGNFFVSVKGTDIVLNTANEPNPYRLELDYPFYSGTVTYRTDFNLDKKYPKLILNLHDVRDSAEVKVNGKSVGKRVWAPYMLDIANFAQIGDNKLEIEVRNNMTNLIYGNPRSLGLQNPPNLAGFER